MGDADGDTPITKAILDDVVDKLVKMISDNGKEAKTDSQELRTLATSTKNVQTQVLEKANRFDTDYSSTSDKPPPAPGHKLRFPKYDCSDDPIT
jgi:hypothetical protein